MKAAATGVAFGALIVLAGSPAAAQATKVGFAMGAAVPTGGIALHDTLRSRSLDGRPDRSTGLTGGAPR
jgi:hypothetical protein